MSHPIDPSTIERILVVYTDGACSGNPGPGGWAWALAPSGERTGSGGERNTTNQRMELTAAFEALKTNVPIAQAEMKRLKEKLINEASAKILQAQSQTQSSE